ncbi:MAG: multiheme c-type cytochrome [Acidobacteriota bacterium]
MSTRNAIFCALSMMSFIAVPLVSAVGTPEQTVELATDRLNRSEVCGTCHVQIYEAWEDSEHARSFTGSIFQAALEQTADTRGKKARRVCLSCHAPVALVSGDYDVSDAVTREGIGCDFCHSVTSVDLARWPMPFEIVLDGVKRGPFEYLESSAHRTALSQLHRASPLLCAACHEYRNDHGVRVLSTYTEWLEGPYPGLGVTCQDCHMAIVPGERVLADLASGPGERLMNLHRLVGSSSLSQLQRGLDASVRTVKREAGRAEVQIEVRNVAAGHKVPTGLPHKRVKLVLEARQGNRLIYSGERVYTRTLVDGEGGRSSTDAGVFLDSVRVSGDTRLAPKETRVERFRFSVPPGKLSFSARLLYQYQPLASEQALEETIRELQGTIPH